MAAPKYLYRNPVTGQVTEVIATEVGPSPEVVVSTGPGGLIDPSLLPVIQGGSQAVTGEAINAGAYVYVKLSGSPSTPLLFNAVWSAGGNQAIGFVAESYGVGQLATYYDDGQNEFLGAGSPPTVLAPGVRYYGDQTNPGGATLIVPTGAGVLAQFLGYAVSTTTIESDIQDAIILAS